MTEQGQNAQYPQPFGQKYTLLERIGKGGMGVVFKAVRADAEGKQQVVALKIVLGLDVENQKRFLREIRALTMLKHENIIPLHDAGEQDGHPYFTMSLIEECKTLDEMMANYAEMGVTPELRTRAGAEYVRQVATAIADAHQHRIVHRDIKPKNILISPKDTKKAYITDFGLAYIPDASRITASDCALGTPGYMSPEQALGYRRLIGPKTDIYGLGATLYFVLTNKPPFDGDTFLSTISRVREEEPLLPSRVANSVPQELEAICMKALAKDPEHRYASAELFARDLQTFLIATKRRNASV